MVRKIQCTEPEQPEPKVSRAAYQRGYSARMAGRKNDTNPYPSAKDGFSDERRDWFAGWLAATYEPLMTRTS